MDVAVVGCGRWGSRHLSTLRRLKDKGLIRRLVAVDTCQETLLQIEDVDDRYLVLPPHECDLAIVATPSEDHVLRAIELIVQGRHVLVEKPLGCDEKEAASLLSTALQHGRILMVGMILRFHPAIKKAHSIISRGEIGRILEFNFIRRKINSVRQGSDVIEELGIHGIDLACYILGECDPNALIVSGNEIDARMTLEFPHGIEAHIDVAWEADEEINRIEIVGENSTIVINPKTHNSLRVIDSMGEEEIETDVDIQPLELELRTFIQAAQAYNRGDNWTTQPDHGAALRGVKLIEKATHRPTLAWPD